MLHSQIQMLNNFAALDSNLQKNNAEYEASKEPFEGEDPTSNAGIYKATYIPDPKYVYIGQASDFTRRWKEHTEDFNRECHCGFFGKFYKEHKCKPSDFRWEILNRINPHNKQLINEREIYLIRKYDNDEKYIILNSIKYKENS